MFDDVIKVHRSITASDVCVSAEWFQRWLKLIWLFFPKLIRSCSLILTKMFIFNRKTLKLLYFKLLYKEINTWKENLEVVTFIIVYRSSGTSQYKVAMMG